MSFGNFELTIGILCEVDNQIIIASLNGTQINICISCNDRIYEKCKFFGVEIKKRYYLETFTLTAVGPFCPISTS